MHIKNFNPRSCERSDPSDVTTHTCGSEISIHAPARGATSLFESNRKHTYISIHAPARGATGSSSGSIGGQSDFNPRSCERSDHQPLCCLSVQFYFNPRSCERSDLSPFAYSPALLSISIHAPARGATSILLPIPNSKYNFNPRSCERSDWKFQNPNIFFCNFNPRSCERSDSKNHVFLSK